MSVLLQWLLHTLSQARQNRLLPNHFNFLDTKMVQFPARPNHHTFLLNPQPSWAQYNHRWVFVAVHWHSLSPNKSFSDLDEHHCKNFPFARGNTIRRDRRESCWFRVCAEIRDFREFQLHFPKHRRPRGADWWGFFQACVNKEICILQIFKANTVFEGKCVILKSTEI